MTLRRTDQPAVAAIAIALLLSIVSYCAYSTYYDGRLIDIDRAEPLAIDTRINVNDASWPELALLPNIGEQLAKRIIDDRSQNGLFRSLDDLIRVRGIGPKTLETLRPFLTPIPDSSTPASSPATQPVSLIH